MYRDSKDRCKDIPTKASLSLEKFLGLETGFTLDKESNTMAVICSDMVVLLAFDSREILIQWQVKIRSNLAEEHSYLVQVSHVPARSKLPCGPARLHLQDYMFCLVSGVPPKLLGIWSLKELRRFGVVEAKFCFEGGSRCGKGEGLFILLTNQTTDLSEAFDLASRGKLASRSRPAARANSVLDTSFRRSLQPRSMSRHSEKYRSESNQPFLSLGSDGSSYDACSENIRFSSDLLTQNENYPVSGTCKTRHRCPSLTSQLTTSFISKDSDMESPQTISLALGCPREPTPEILNQCLESNVNMNILDIERDWNANQCGKCGRHYCPSNKLTSASPQTRHENSALASQWCPNIKAGSPGKEIVFQGNTVIVGSGKRRPSDRSSMSSQSSHSSSASSSGSDYSLPKNCLDNVYGKLRGAHVTKQPPSLPKLFMRRSVPIQEEISGVVTSSAQKQGKWANNLHTSSAIENSEKFWSNDAIPRVHKRSASCSCTSRPVDELNKPKVSTNNVGKLFGSTPKMNITGSPSGSPVRQKRQDVEILRSQKSTDSTYVHYAVPKPILLNDQDKEKQLKNQTQNSQVPLLTMNHYDVPRKITEKFQREKTTEIPTRVCCTCNFYKNVDQSKPPQQNFDRNLKIQICDCQRMLLWTGNLVPFCRSDSLENWSRSAGSDTHEYESKDKTRLGPVCIEPTKRLTEVHFLNGKQKHILLNSDLRELESNASKSSKTKERVDNGENSVETVNILTSAKESLHLLDASINYVNFQKPRNYKRDGKCKLVNNFSNYANLEFLEPYLDNPTLSLQDDEGPVVVHELSRSNIEQVISDRPPKEYEDISDLNTGIASQKNIPSSMHDKESVYEIMTCQDKTTHSFNSTNDNYLPMEPKESWKSLVSIPSLSNFDLVSDNSIFINSFEKSQNTDKHLLLRPFLPFVVPSSKNHDTAQKIDSTSKSDLRIQVREFYNPAIQKDIFSTKLPSRTNRSNSLGNLKKKVFMRTRSKSIESRQNRDDPSQHFETSGPVSRKKHSFFTKLGLINKKKSFRTDYLSSLPSVPTSPNDHSLNSFSRSAGCLIGDEDSIMSEYDFLGLPLSSQKMSLRDGFSQLSVIKRSRSVPFKSKRNDYWMKASVSHETSHRLREVGFPSSNVVDSICIHGSLPRTQHENKSVSAHKVSSVQTGIEERGKQEFSSESNKYLGTAGKLDNAATSSSSSDISDIIEALSLCSQSSSSSVSFL
ncbi:uncharacterized protein LOC143255808 isoform X2 [Tachypleus tridentatus]